MNVPVPCSLQIVLLRTGESCWGMQPRSAPCSTACCITGTCSSVALEVGEPNLMCRSNRQRRTFKSRDGPDRLWNGDLTTANGPTPHEVLRLEYRSLLTGFLLQHLRRHSTSFRNPSGRATTLIRESPDAWLSPRSLRV